MVEDHRLTELPLLNRHAESFQHKILRLTGVARPAPYFPEEHIADATAKKFPPFGGCAAVSAHHNWLGPSAVSRRLARRATVMRCTVAVAPLGPENTPQPGL